MDTGSDRKLIELLKKIPRCTIAVVGDLMLDRYVWGKVARISPEAPVPVVEVASESANLGGAANVANNIHGLGATAIPVGVIGEDLAGEQLHGLVREAGFKTEGILRLTGRMTTVKTRVLAHNQHVVRVDRESNSHIDEETATRVLNFLSELAPQLDAIVLEDYNKGMLTPELIREIIHLAGARHIPVTVDPKFANFFAFEGATVFKPNRKEAAEALALPLVHSVEIREAAARLQARLSCANVLITLGSEGMLLRTENGGEHMIPTKAQKVHDVSGAGDTVIGTLTAALAAGACALDAALLANYAAGVVVAEPGAVPISTENLARAIESDSTGGA